MNRKERRRRTRLIVLRRRRIAKIKSIQGYNVPAPEAIADGFFRKNGFMCHHYGSVRSKRKFRQQATSRYWSHRPHFEMKTIDYCRNEWRQVNSMEDAEKTYYTGSED